MYDLMKLKLFDIEISNLPQYQLLSVWHCEMKLIFKTIPCETELKNFPPLKVYQDYNFVASLFIFLTGIKKPSPLLESFKFAQNILLVFQSPHLPLDTQFWTRGFLW